MERNSHQNTNFKTCVIGISIKTEMTSVFTQYPNFKGHLLGLALCRKLLRFYPERDVPTSLVSVRKKGSVRKLHCGIICLKEPQAQLTLWLKPTTFGLFTEILQTC